MYPYTKEGRAAATAGEVCVDGRDENGGSAGGGVTSLPEVSGVPCKTPLTRYGRRAPFFLSSSLDNTSATYPINYQPMA